MKRLYEALVSNPAKWARTMLVICYDEHGGFFDHVAPPPMTYAPPQGNTWLDTSPFQTLGGRIPAIVVSPWVEPGTCFRELADHTSILQLMVDRFGEPSDLVYFGDAVARKANKVTSLAAALNAPGPHLSVIPLGDAPSISGGATSPPLSDAARMFRGVIADKPAKAT